MWTETDAVYENDTHLNSYRGLPCVSFACQNFAVFTVPLWWPYHFWPENNMQSTLIHKKKYPPPATHFCHTDSDRQKSASLSFSPYVLPTILSTQRFDNLGNSVISEIVAWNPLCSHQFTAAAGPYILPWESSIWNWEGRGTSSWWKIWQLPFNTSFCNSSYPDSHFLKIVFIWEQSNASEHVLWVYYNPALARTCFLSGKQPLAQARPCTW